MLNIEIRTIPHHLQRYPTCGDYWEDPYAVHFRISQMSDWRYEALVAAHELVEYFICKFKKIAIEDIDAFDIEYEKNRQPGDFSEPGNDPNAPYYLAHQIATKVEVALSLALGVDRDTYEKVIESL